MAVMRARWSASIVPIPFAPFIMPLAPFIMPFAPFIMPLAPFIMPFAPFMPGRPAGVGSWAAARPAVPTSRARMPPAMRPVRFDAMVSSPSLDAEQASGLLVFLFGDLAAREARPQDLARVVGQRPVSPAQGGHESPHDQHEQDDPQDHPGPPPEPHPPVKAGHHRCHLHDVESRTVRFDGSTLRQGVQDVVGIPVKVSSRSADGRTARPSARSSGAQGGPSPASPGSQVVRRS